MSTQLLLLLRYDSTLTIDFLARPWPGSWSITYRKTRITILGQEVSVIPVRYFIIRSVVEYAHRIHQDQSEK